MRGCLQLFWSVFKSLKEEERGLRSCIKLEWMGTVTIGYHFEEIWRGNNNSNSNKLLLLSGKNCPKQIICVISLSLHNNLLRYIVPILPVRHVKRGRNLPQDHTASKGSISGNFDYKSHTLNYDSLLQCWYCLICHEQQL